MDNNRRIISIALFAALAIVLDLIKAFLPFLNMPFGGSINIALIPVVFASFYLGYKDGVVTGFLWWLISTLLNLNSSFVSIPQYVLDYIIPSTIVGLSSIFYKKKNNREIIVGILFVMFFRTLSIVISGIYFWCGDLASGSIEAIVASLSYNLPYSIATTIMLVIVIPTIIKRIKK